MTSPLKGPPRHFTRFNAKDAGTSGAWGDVTASLDWCEGNYPFSWLPLAEPINTLTNLSFIWLAWFGWTKANENKLARDSAWIYMGIGVVGIGSFLFHGTLRYEYQLLDELPMVYGSTLMACVSLNVLRHASSKNRYTALTAGSNPRGLLPICILYDIAVTVIYLFYPNPVFHQVSYGLTVAVQVFRIGYLLFTRLLSTPEESRVNTKIRQLSFVGLGMYLLGFAIWNVDNQLCARLTSIKEDIGFPARIMLEGHAYWHILTGAGAYYGAVGVSMLSHCLNEGIEDFEIRWSYAVVPWVHRKQKKAKGKGKKRIE